MRSLKLHNLHIFGITAVFFLTVSLFLKLLVNKSDITFYYLLAIFVVSTIAIIWNAWLGGYCIYKIQMGYDYIPSKREDDSIFIFMFSRLYYIACLLISYILLSEYIKIMKILPSVSYESLIRTLIIFVFYIGFYLVIKRQNKYEDEKHTVINLNEAFTFVGTAVIGIIIYMFVKFDIPIYLMTKGQVISICSFAIITLIWCSFVGSFYYFLIFDTIKNWGNTNNLTTKLYHIGISLVYMLINCFILIYIGHIQMISKIFHENFFIYVFGGIVVLIAIKSWDDPIMPKIQES